MSIDIIHEGYTAFTNGKSQDECPYGDWKKRKKWLRGWEDALDDMKRHDREVERREAWIGKCTSCPWFKDDGTCKAAGLICSEDNCAPYYFISNE